MDPTRLVIFDCDGVLVDSEPLANHVLADAMAQLGLEAPLDVVHERFVGRSMVDVVAGIEADLGRPLPDDWLDALQRRTFAVFERDLQPVRGVAAALDRIDAATCVASSGAPDKIRFTLGLTGLLERFDDRLFSATQVPRGKPFPDLFLHAAEQMGHSPDACVVIEDSLPGVKAAQAAGMTVLGFAGTELADAQELGAAGATVFSDMRDLAALLA